MSSRFKKVSLALYLDPAQSKADNFAFKTLSAWAKRRQELSLDASATMELHQLVHLHKDIYLSGLFLHQLKPELAKSVASALSGDTITSAALLDALSMNQITATLQREGSSEDYSKQFEEVLAKQESTSAFLEEIKSLVSDKSEVNNSTVDYSENFDALLSTQTDSVQQISEMNNAIVAMQKQLSEGSSVKSEPTNTDTSAIESDYSDRLESLLTQQSESHQQIAEANKQISSLQQLVREQNRLINQLMQQGFTAGSRQPSTGTSSDPKSPMLPDEPKEVVEERLARVQKMKKKGVF